MRALRHTKTGELYPMHEQLAKHPDVEFVDLDENMQVIEPEEVGPAAAEPVKDPAPRNRSRTKKVETEEPANESTGDDLSIGDE